MAEENKPPETEKKKKLFEIKSDKVREASEFISNRWVEFGSAALMILGIIFTFFYHHFGSVLVGLAVGMCFYDGISSYFAHLGERYTAQGLFKTLMVIGTVLFLLLIAPGFLIAAAAAYGIVALVRWGMRPKT